MSQDQKKRPPSPAFTGQAEKEAAKLRKLLRRTYETFQMQVPDFHDKEVEAALDGGAVELPAAYPVEGAVEER